MKFGCWKIAGYNRKSAVELCHGGIGPLMAVMLASRGVETVEEARRRMNDSLALLHDPMLMADMDKAVARIERAIRDKEHVAVFGDYDVDGITSTAVIVNFFRSKGLEYEVYIPERQDEGYGVNKNAIDLLHSKGVTLLITVDCGVTAVEETEYAKQLGMDMVITDHHECKEQLPDSVAVVDPHRADCAYPFKNLAGVGVAFKLVCAVEKDKTPEELIAAYGDLVAIGTIADVMPVVGENRALIRHGLRAIPKIGRPGLMRLLEELDIDKSKVVTANVGYAIAPRLNAAGRMGRATRSVRLLLTESTQEAELLTEELCGLNRSRQEIEAEMFQEVLELLEKDPPAGKPVVLAKYGWHQGVAGIVSSRLIEKCCVPAILICLENGEGKGSCRSYNNFPLYEALSHCKEHLKSFGGHEVAAGLVIREENIAAFREAFQAYYCANVDVTEKPVLNIDLEVIKPGLLTVPNVEELEDMEPYGNENPPPRLCIKRALVESIAGIGGGKHVKMRLSKNGETFDAVYFSKTMEELGIRARDYVDVAFIPHINDFRGRRSVQLHISDVGVCR